MELTCDCSDDYDFYYDCDNEYHESQFNHRCYDCWKIIKKGEPHLKFHCYQHGEDGDEINHKLHRFCEDCSDIFLNLHDKGYCMMFPSRERRRSMRSALLQYQELQREQYERRNIHFKPLKVSVPVGAIDQRYAYKLLQEKADREFRKM